MAGLVFLQYRRVCPDLATFSISRLDIRRSDEFSGYDARATGGAATTSRDHDHDKSQSADDGGRRSVPPVVDAGQLRARG